MPAGLVAAYGFNEGAGSTTADSSWNANTGTISGAAWAASGRYGGALSFNGTSSRVDINDANSLDLTSGLTIEAWVYPTALSGWRTVILKETSADLVYGLYAYDNAPRPAGYVYVGGNYFDAPGTTSIPLNAWTHLAATHDGATLRLFVNGNQVGSRTATGNITVSTGPLRIGGNLVWGEYFSGNIDEVRIYNRALSPAEIQTDMNTPVSGDTTPPTVPGTLTATPVSSTQINLSWVASTDNVGVTGYQVERCQGAGCSNFALVTSVTGTTYSNTGLTASTAYSYRVRAADAAGNISGYSNTASAITQASADTTPPTVTSVTPASGATGIDIGVNVTATFSEAMDPATIGSGTVELRDPSSALVSAVVTYNTSYADGHPRSSRVALAGASDLYGHRQGRHYRGEGCGGQCPGEQLHLVVYNGSGSRRVRSRPAGMRATCMCIAVAADLRKRFRACTRR